MARPETLVPGNCYFSVDYYDTDLMLPMRVPDETPHRSVKNASIWLSVSSRITIRRKPTICSRPIRNDTS